MVHSPETEIPSVDVGLASFFSALELRDIAATRAEAAAPGREVAPAAVLFADLAGFSALAEALGAQGPRGAEELSRLIDAHFGRLTDLVLAAGGDILAFAGDAALVAWLAGDAPLATAVARAAAAGLSLQADADRPAQGGLRMRVAIGAGPLARLRVGGLSGRWLFVAAGDPITQAAAADRLAGEGDVVLSPEAAALIRSRSSGIALEAGALRLTGVTPEATPEHLRPPFHAANLSARLRSLIPESISTRIGGELGTWLGEFRRVTMVFCGLGDLDPSDPAALERVQRAVMLLQQEVARLDGTVYQLLSDDKGTTFVSAFGLPPRAHEEDAARGTLAALGMQAALRRLGLAPSIGVATGVLYCGVYGTLRRRQYTVAGPAVNLAARLMQHSAGSVLCDPETRDRARRYPGLRFTDLEPISVKGRDQPVPVHAPSAVTEAVAVIDFAEGGEPPLGREPECAALDTALADLTERRQGGIVLLEGDPGIGKSRLIRYLQGSAHRRGVRVLACAGDDIEKAAAYHAWSRLFRGLAGSDPSQVSNRLGLGPDRTPLVPLLGPLLGLDLGVSDLAAAMTDEVRATNTRNLLLASLEHLDESGPVVVTIEDAHWLDSSSWALLLAAARTIPTLLFVVTSRPTDAPPPDYSALGDLAAGRRLRLQPLGLEAVERLLGRRLGVRSLPDPVLSLVWQRAAGNPFFSEELGYALRDYGLISVIDGRCELADPARELAAALTDVLATRGLPATVQGVVTSRIDRLNQAEQVALRVASVIGRTFPVTMLREVYPVPATHQEIGASLARLEGMDLIRPEPDASEPSFSFRHAITQQVAYDMTLYSQRRDLHRSIGEWLEARHPDDQAPVLPLLALHWRRAEVVPKAVHYLGQAGEQAIQNFANAEAVTFFHDALLLGPHAARDQRSRWELQAGRACVNWSRYSDGEQHLRRGLALAGQRMPRRAAAVAGALLSQIARQTLHRRFPGRFVGRRGAEREKLLGMARAQEALVEVFYLRDASLDCLHCAVRGLNLAELAGPSPELARGYATVGAILGFVPLPGMADAYCQRALATAREVGDVPATVWTALSVGAYKLGVAAWDEAQPLFDLVTRESERLGDARRWDDGIQFLSDLNILRGRFETGLELAGRLYRSAARRNDPRGQASAVYRQALCHLTLGRDVEAVAGTEEIRALRWNVGTVHGDLPVCTLRGLTALRTGDIETADRMTREGAAMLRKLMPAYHGYVFDAVGISDVLLQLLERPDDRPGTAGATRARRQALRSALGALRRLARVFPIGRPWLALMKGRWERLRGHRDAAVAAWRSTLLLGQNLDLQYPVALAHLELAATLRPGDPAHSTHREQARQLLSRIGAAPDLQRLEAGQQ